ncbi:MAG: HPr family phosphocarrier protein [Eubacteriaceae bacterium]|jgi:phosphotransferase system HPr (HPr) family protein|nr:HPr family phosphocarrier protein [Eubacteriaceae bacterium]
MYIKSAVLKAVDTTGIKPVSSFVEAAKKFESRITIINKNEQINAKSFRGLLVSALRIGSKILVMADGPDEQEAVSLLCELI